MLRTLTRVTNANRTELNVVCAWARGTGQRPVPHPSLYHIGLIQRAPIGAANPQQLSHWFKRETGAWARVSVAPVGPTHSFTL